MADNDFKYSWQETNLASFMDKYSLPAYYENDNLITYISNYAEEYISDFDSILLNGPIKGYSEEVYEKLSEQKEHIKNNFDSIIKILEYINSSYYGQAEQIIDNLFQNIESDFCITDIKNYTQFVPHLYRIRTTIGNPDNPMELFHIPNNKCHLLKNERFSVSGQPCLYLSTSLNIAWKECGLPSSFYYSTFKYDYEKAKNKNWKFLSLLKPRDIMNDLLVTPHFENETFELEFICKYLRTFPIIFACSIISTKKDSPFKPEYVFPQLVMQWIHRNTDRIKGIMYFSCVFDDDDFRQWVGYNIALPATDFDANGYSKPLLEMFEISAPIYEDNTLPEEQKIKFNNLFKEIRLFNCVMGEMADCWIEMHRLVRYICMMIDESSNTSSKIQLGLADLLRREVDTFPSKYNIDEIVNKCKDSPGYQSRYDTYINQFKKIYDDFIILSRLFDYYCLILEHNFQKDFLLQQSEKV